MIMASGQPSAACDSAARRRRERRLLSWLRHELMTVAMALAEKLHHSAQRPLMARAGEEGHEDKYNAPWRQKPLLRRRSSSCLTMKTPRRECGRPAWPSRRDLRNGSSCAPWSTSPTWCPWSRSSIFLCCRPDVGGVAAPRFPHPRAGYRSATISASPCHSRKVLIAPQTAEQLVEVPTIVSFSSAAHCRAN